MNVADDVEGVSFGLVSVTNSGGVHPTARGGTATYGNVALEFAIRCTYTFVSVSAHETDAHTHFGVERTLLSGLERVRP